LDEIHTDIGSTVGCGKEVGFGASSVEEIVSRGRVGEEVQALAKKTNKKTPLASRLPRALGIDLPVALLLT
jgi:hypothetical protein